MDTKKAVLLIALGIGGMALVELGAPAREGGAASRAPVVESPAVAVASESESMVALPGARVAQTKELVTAQ